MDTTRDHGKTVFLDLRDRYGRTQVVVNPDAGDAALDLAKSLRCEDVALFTGVVQRRLEGKSNEKLDTGEIELIADEVKVLNRCLTPPFFPNQAELPGEDLRLKYRYIDLRREQMQAAPCCCASSRPCETTGADQQFPHRCGTLILGRSTPEGARDDWVQAVCIGASSSRCRNLRSFTNRS
ncbi:MAG: OB-fold nucleic acid binding domain-containing protein [Pirellulales bacterium]